MFTFTHTPIESFANGNNNSPRTYASPHEQANETNKQTKDSLVMPFKEAITKWMHFTTLPMFPVSISVHADDCTKDRSTLHSWSHTHQGAARVLPVEHTPASCSWASSRIMVAYRTNCPDESNPRKPALSTRRNR